MLEDSLTDAREHANFFNSVNESLVNISIKVGHCLSGSVT